MCVYACTVPRIGMSACTRKCGVGTVDQGRDTVGQGMASSQLVFVSRNSSGRKECFEQREVRYPSRAEEDNRVGIHNLIAA